MRTLLLLSPVVLATLVACGGGGVADTDPAVAADAASSPARSQAQGFFPPNTSVPTDAHLKGMWSPVYSWPHIAIHTVLMPDGRVLTYGAQTNGSQSGRFQYDIWEGSASPASGHTTLTNTAQTEIFCSSQIMLPETNTVFIGGGDNWTGTQVNNTANRTSTLINGDTNALTRTNDLKRARWYSSSTTLISGETYIQGGNSGGDRPEIRSRDGQFRLLDSINTSSLQTDYPHNFVVSDGRVFGFDGGGRMYYVDTTNGTLTNVGQFSNSYAGSDTSSAMYRPGRILQVGGNSSGALLIDVTNGGTPVVTPTQSLSSQRRLVSATILADGQVAATGGSQVWNSMTGVNYLAEIWNPTTGQWTQGAAGNRARLYHSGAILQPDASVLVLGGGANSPTSSLPQNNNNVEVYYPPYLFAAGGTRATRPTLASTPMAIEIGKTFGITVGANDVVKRVTLVKTSAVTHNRNMDQRFIELTYTAQGANVQVQAPTRAGDATPGYYMLFVINDKGVPSEAKIVSMGIASNPNPSTVPVLTNPSNQSGQVGTAVTLSLQASDPNGDTLRYNASGLPTGLTVNASTGQITGTPTTAGSYNVSATASDGVNVASAAFVWSVNNPAPLSVTAIDMAQPTVANGVASFDASTSGGLAPTYSWNFGDGSPATAFATTASAQHAYAAPGTYNVTFTAKDTRGELVSRSFTQVIYLPKTSNQPTASSPLALESASGVTRLWAVNPDNDSVTAFNAVTRAKLGEVATGAGPRTVAVALDGKVWVTNKFDATLSVIDPTTRAVLSTITLPRASQPHGIAMSPTSAVAYVALEATGQMLRLSTSTRAITGTVSVGANPRHVSVSADGAKVYVSRFISPQLPGEATAAVAPTLATGGELLEVNASTLAIHKTVVLRVSDVPDGEASGRGLPNYLGAAAISPDGTQAWVPSKIDNVQRGALRDSLPLNFQNTVRAAASRVALATGSEDYSKRVDLDNASMASAAAFDPLGVYLFVALETSREVAVVDAHGGRQVTRFDVGRAPQGLLVSPDGQTLYVHNFMDRTVGVHDLRPLLQQGLASAPLLATLSTVNTDKLPAQVLKGKQFFYDARDPRLALDRYMSCASCHNDGSHDGRTWDMTHAGEGLRNTASLRGRAGAQGRLHWSGNFDEVQDFEAQIRSLAGGTGLMSDAQLNAGSRAQALGDKKAGLSADLDALAAYVGSLSTVEASPHRQADGSLSAQALTGRTVFAAQCASCHQGNAFTDSDTRVLRDVGTLKASSGKRLGTTLNGLDTPTLRDAWATAPYLHDGSAATVESAISAHSGLALSASDLAAVSAFTREIGGDEANAPASTAALTLRAYGTPAGWIGPLVQVRAGGAVIAKMQIDAESAQDIRINSGTLPAGSALDVVFVNDDLVGSEDRNLSVERLVVNGSTQLSATDPALMIDPGDGGDAFDGVGLLSASSTGGWLPWNGAMRFKTPGAPTGGNSSVTVRAMATLAGGVGASMDLRINGTLIGTQTVSSTTFQDYVFAAPSVAPGDRIDVVFTNDAFINGEDRNLVVESIVAAGTVFTPSSAGAILDWGDGVAAYDGVDTFEADATGGWLPWNGAFRVIAPSGKPPATTPLTLRASATLAAGLGANVELWVNGFQYGTATVSTENLTDLVFQIPALKTGDKVDVVFTNDAFINGEDRNLYIESIASGTFTLSPLNTSARIDQGNGADAFDGLAVVNAADFGGWVPWTAALRLTVP